MQNMPVTPTMAMRLHYRERPDRAHVMYQRWDKLLFLHWRVSAEQIQSTLPPGLFVDTFDGSAWVAIVPFYMLGIRPRFCPPVPGISNFLELNVRTYVHDEQGRPGVWFFSLDCNQSLAVWTARTFFHLPYQHAQMQATAQGAHVDYRCQRRGAPKQSRYHYQIHEQTHLAEPGSLEFFVAERYLLFAQTPAGIRCGQVNHVPYPLAVATVDSWDAAPLEQAGFAPGRPPDNILASPGVDVRIYALTK
jgi:hypothetical protein